MAGNGPDELEAVEKAGKGVFDGLEVPLRDVLELALKRGQELYEVLGFGVLLVERRALYSEAVDGLVLLAGIFGFQNLKTLQNLN